MKLTRRSVVWGPCRRCAGRRRRTLARWTFRSRRPVSFASIRTPPPAWRHPTPPPPPWPATRSPSPSADRRRRHRSSSLPFRFLRVSQVGWVFALHDLSSWFHFNIFFNPFLPCGFTARKCRNEIDSILFFEKTLNVSFHSQSFRVVSSWLKISSWFHSFFMFPVFHKTPLHPLN